MPSRPDFGSPPPAARSSRWSGRLLIGGILIGVVVAAVLGARPVVNQFTSSDKDKYKHLLTDIAHRGPFLLTVDIQGNLDSQQNVTVNSNVEKATTIISIVPEGTWVEKGEIVCELDAATMIDEANKQQIVVTNAEAAEIQAQQALEVQRLQNLSDIGNAKILYDLAKLDYEKYVSEGGEYERLHNELSGKLELARQEAIQAKERHAFNKEQVKKGFINQNELEASRIQLQEKELAVGQAQKALDVLEKFDKERTTAELKANAEELGLELERVKLKAQAAEAQAEKAYQAARESAELEKAILERLQRQIENCKLRAPQSGEVVYANLSSRRRSSDGPAIEVGAQIDERQPVFHLPDTSKMKVDARVHESLIGNVRVGLPAKIRVDMMPDVIYRGVVAQVATVPTTGSWPNYNLREYPVSINITDDSSKVEKLKPGLTAQVEVFVDSRNDVLQVPIQSVVGLSGNYYTFVLTPNGPQRRELVIGQTNTTAVEIIDGVAEGERVILNPRTHFAEEIAELAGKLGSASDQQDAIDTEDKIEGAPPSPSLETPGKPGESAPGSPFQKDGAGPTADAGGGRPGGENSPGGGRGNPARMFATLDVNKDGKLAGDEIPDQMKDRLSSIDTDSDGAISQDEMKAASQRLRSGGSGRSGDSPEGAAGG